MSETKGGIKGVLFDVDGTLIDSVDAHAKAWQVVLARHGFDIPFERVRHQIGKGGQKLLAALLPADVVERHGKAIERERLELFKREYLPHVRAFPRVRDLFERIKADGRRIVLASSARREELEEYKRIAGIADLIDGETSSDDAERSKPDPDIFLAALEKLGDVPPEAAIAVGDSPYDAEAAGKAGVRTIGLLCGGFPESELHAAGCIAIFRDPADLLDRYDESPLGNSGRSQSVT
jgi:HAD superfamily hydrolase (TIGR01509 family)